MKIFDERGITLIELLVTLSISAILFPVMYGVLTSGMKVYDNITVDASIREDADYVSSMVMNDLYANPFDYAKACEKEANCFEFVANTAFTSKKYGDGDTFNEITRSEDGAEVKIRTIRVDEGANSTISIDGTPISLQANYTGSTMEMLSCNGEPVSEETPVDKCEEGVIELTLFVRTKQQTEPVELKSQFGF